MKGKDREELNVSLKLLVKTSVIVFVSVFLSKLLTYIYRIVIARGYGPEVYGLLALSLMIVGWGAAFITFGLDRGLLRYIPFYRGKNQKQNISFIFKRVLGLLAVSSIIGGLLLYFLSGVIANSLFNEPQLEVFLKFFSLIIPIGVLSGVFFSVIRSYERIGWFSFSSRILGNLIRVIFIVLLVLLGVNANAVPISYLIGSAIALIVGYVYCRVSFPGIFKHNGMSKTKKKKVFGNVLSYSWPLIFFGLAATIFHWTDTFVIGIFQGAGDVGLYNAAIPIALLITMSTDLFTQLFFPLVTREYSKGRKEVVKKLSKQVGKWIFMLSLPVFVLLIIFPDIVIRILFGQEFLAGSSALRFLAVGMLFTGLFEVSKELLSMKGNSRLILIDVVVITILNLILNFILVPRLGINGAAISTMISMVLLSVIFAFQAWKKVGVIPIKKKMVKIVLISVALGAILLYVKSLMVITILSAVLLGAAFAVLYVLLVFLTGCLDENDKLIVDLAKRKLNGYR